MMLHRFQVLHFALHFAFRFHKETLVSNRQLQKPRRQCQAFAPPGQDQLQMAMDPTAPRVKVRATARRCACDSW
jgi:hypothetical protein